MNKSDGHQDDVTNQGSGKKRATALPVTPETKHAKPSLEKVSEEHSQVATKNNNVPVEVRD